MNTSFDVRLRGAVLASGVSREEAKKVCMAHQGSVIIPVAPKSNGAAKAQSPAPSAKRPKYTRSSA